MLIGRIGPSLIVPTVSLHFEQRTADKISVNLEAVYIKLYRPFLGRQKEKKNIRSLSLLGDYIFLFFFLLRGTIYSMFYLFPPLLFVLSF